MVENNTDSHQVKNDVVQTQEKVTDTKNQEKISESENHGKSFTQEELNQILAKRLEKYKDYDELVNYRNSAEESKLSETEKLTKRIQELEPIETKYKEAHKTLEKLLEKNIDLIPEEKRKLIPTNFSVTEKLNYINNNSEFLLGQNINIKTPENQKLSGDKGNPNLIFGKYTSIEDFASKDKQGFLKAIKTQAYIDELKRVGLLS